MSKWPRYIFFASFWACVLSPLALIAAGLFRNMGYKPLELVIVHWAIICFCCGVGGFIIAFIFSTPIEYEPAMIETTAIGEIVVSGHLWVGDLVRPRRLSLIDTAPEGTYSILLERWRRKATQGNAPDRCENQKITLSIGYIGDFGPDKPIEIASDSASVFFFGAESELSFSDRTVQQAADAAWKSAIDDGEEFGLIRSSTGEAIGIVVHVEEGVFPVDIRKAADGKHLEIEVDFRIPEDDDA